MLLLDRVLGVCQLLNLSLFLREESLGLIGVQ